MAENMAVVHEIPNHRPAEVHSNLDARIRTGSTPIRNLHGIQILSAIHRPAILFQQQEVDLVDMEFVVFLRAVFDCPVFDLALPGYDRGRIGRIEENGVCPSTVM